jgi:hypothetical protein
MSVGGHSRRFDPALTASGFHPTPDDRCTCVRSRRDRPAFYPGVWLWPSKCISPGPPCGAPGRRGGTAVAIMLSPKTKTGGRRRDRHKCQSRLLRCWTPVSDQMSCAIVGGILDHVVLHPLETRSFCRSKRQRPFLGQRVVDRRRRNRPPICQLQLPGSNAPVRSSRITRCCQLGLGPRSRRKFT